MLAACVLKCKWCLLEGRGFDRIHRMGRIQDREVCRRERKGHRGGMRHETIDWRLETEAGKSQVYSL